MIATHETLSFYHLPDTCPPLVPHHCSAIERRSASALAVQKPYGQAQLRGLAQQQRNIRLGF